MRSTNKILDRWSDFFDQDEFHNSLFSTLINGIETNEKFMIELLDQIKEEKLLKDSIKPQFWSLN